MKNFNRLLILDRSRLAHNVFETILRPLGFSLLHCHSFKELKSMVTPRLGCRWFLIGSNTFGKKFEEQWEWLQNEALLQRHNKIFLCGEHEKKIAARLKGLSRSRILLKPFHPSELAKAVQRG